MNTASLILGVTAVVIAIGAAIYDTVQVEHLRHAVNDIKEDLKVIKEKAWVRGAKGRFERLVPQEKQELVPGVTSELAEPRYDD